MDLLNKSFSHIYVEKEARTFEECNKILKKFSNSQIIEIDSYKEVFSKIIKILFYKKNLLNLF